MQARLPGSPALATSLIQLARPRRYAALDLYGLAAGLATTWAALVASRPDAVNNSWATDILYYCAALLQTVRPPPARPAPSRAARRGPHRRPRATQAVGHWCEADESRAWGKAATSAVLAQYHPGLARVFLWLASVSPAPPMREFTRGAVALRTCGDARFKVRGAARSRFRPCAGTGEPDPRPPQLLLSTARLYDGLHAAGTGPHAGPHVAFLTASCSAAGGDLLVLALQPCAAVAGAPAGRPSGGAPAGPYWPSWRSKGNEGCSHPGQGAFYVSRALLLVLGARICMEVSFSLSPCWRQRGGRATMHAGQNFRLCAAPCSHAGAPVRRPAWLPAPQATERHSCTPLARRCTAPSWRPGRTPCCSSPAGTRSPTRWSGGCMPCWSTA